MRVSVRRSVKSNANNCVVHWIFHLRRGFVKRQKKKRINTRGSMISPHRFVQKSSPPNVLRGTSSEKVFLENQVTMDRKTPSAPDKENVPVECAGSDCLFTFPSFWLSDANGSAVANGLVIRFNNSLHSLAHLNIWIKDLSKNKWQRWPLLIFFFFFKEKFWWSRWRTR